MHPQTRLRFYNQKDLESVELLDILYKDEITHVAAGIRWFQYICNQVKHVRLFIKSWFNIDSSKILFQGLYRQVSRDGESIFQKLPEAAI